MKGALSVCLGAYALVGGEGQWRRQIDSLRVPFGVKETGVEAFNTRRGAFEEREEVSLARTVKVRGRQE